MMRFLYLLFLLSPGLGWASGPVLNPAVTQDTIDQTICVSGYTKGIRPSTSYTNWVKRTMMAEAGIRRPMSDYELDHIVPLELGGHPYALANLQLQPWKGKANAREKDALENYLHRQVCARKISLAGAQQCIYHNWQQCRKAIINGVFS